jgi:phosphatidate phosphatase APP1
VLFATAARLSPDGTHWIVPVHGRVYRPAQGRAARAALALALRTGFGVKPFGPDRVRFDERCGLMLGDNSEGRRIVLTVSGTEHVLPPSGRDGQFRAEIVLPAATVAAHAPHGRLRLEARLARGDEQVFTAAALVVPAAGLSVISDIDDTVKVTHVGDRRRMMRLTFLEAFEAVEGMAQRYRTWADRGAVFHFISSSPWPLYEPLQTFLAEKGFPPATYTLKNVGLKDRSIRHFLSKATKTKPPAIEALLAAFPARRFVLVGDSVENDAEIYAGIARRHPGRIAGILIRLASHRRTSLDRVNRALEGLGGVACQLFTDASELPERLA